MPAPYTISKVLGDDRIVHGFFGREGGRSMGELASNNMSISQGDNPDLVAFLAGPESSAITGVTIPVDAGWLISPNWQTYGGVRPHDD